MTRHTVTAPILGPWSLSTSKAFLAGFTPTAADAQGPDDELHSVFPAESDWRRAEVRVRQHGQEATIEVRGDGDLPAAAGQACRSLALDVDARGWPEVAGRDPVIAEAQARLPGLRPCGFRSPYEAAAWAVLAQRIRIVQAARLREDIIARYGDQGAFPPPHVLRGLELDLPGRKVEYLHAVAEAALDGMLDGAALRSMPPEDAIAQVREITGLGPFAAELVVIRGANAPDVLPTRERRLAAEVAERYGAERSLAEASEAWRPFRTWAAVHLRTLREERTHEIAGRS